MQWDNVLVGLLIGDDSLLEEEKILYNDEDMWF